MKYIVEIVGTRYDPIENEVCEVSSYAEACSAEGAAVEALFLARQYSEEYMNIDDIIRITIKEVN